jgi:hypothetical protein
LMWFVPVALKLRVLSETVIPVQGLSSIAVSSV